MGIGRTHVQKRKCSPGLATSEDRGRKAQDLTEIYQTFTPFYLKKEKESAHKYEEGALSERVNIERKKKKIKTE